MEDRPLLTLVLSVDWFDLGGLGWSEVVAQRLARLPTLVLGQGVTKVLLPELSTTEFRHVYTNQVFRLDFTLFRCSSPDLWFSSTPCLTFSRKS